MKKVFLLVFVIALTAALLGGCFGYYPTQGTPVPSGATPAPTPTVGPQIDPQQLIPKADAEQLVGNALKDPDKDKINTYPAQDLTFCLYDSAVKDGRFLQVSVYQRTVALNDDPKKIFDVIRTPAPSTQPVIAEVSGIGDEAYMAEPGLHIMYKGYYLLIAVGDPKDAANQEILKAAGKKAVENLGKLLGQ